MEKHFIETIIIFSKSRFHDRVYMQIIACLLRDVLRRVVRVTLKSNTKGEGGVKNRAQKRYVIVERSLV